jgi:chromosome segregation ATPase
MAEKFIKEIDELMKPSTKKRARTFQNITDDSSGSPQDEDEREKQRPRVSFNISPAPGISPLRRSNEKTPNSTSTNNTQNYGVASDPMQLDEQLETAKQTITKLENELNTSKETAQVTEKEVEALTKCNAAKDEEISSLERNIEDVKKQIQEKKQKNEELTRQNDLIKKESQEVEKSISEIERKCEEHEGAVKKLEMQIKEKAQEIQLIQGKKSKLEKYFGDSLSRKKDWQSVQAKSGEIIEKLSTFDPNGPQEQFESNMKNICSISGKLYEIRERVAGNKDQRATVRDQMEVLSVIEEAESPSFGDNTSFNPNASSR